MQLGCATDVRRRRVTRCRLLRVPGHTRGRLHAGHQGHVDVGRVRGHAEFGRHRRNAADHRSRRGAQHVGRVAHERRRWHARRRDDDGGAADDAACTATARRRSRWSRPAMPASSRCRRSISSWPATGSRSWICSPRRGRPTRPCSRSASRNDGRRRAGSRPHQLRLAGPVALGGDRRPADHDRGGAFRDGAGDPDRALAGAGRRSRSAATSRARWRPGGGGRGRPGWRR